MGYTHYWYKEKEISKETYKEIITDFQKVLPKIEEHVKLADGMGDNKAVINILKGQVIFNGISQCGHKQHNLGITWPVKNAGGVGDSGKEAKDGQWFAGAKLSTRSCGGDCSHESFVFDRIDSRADADDDYKEKYFNFCKTAFKPYDLAVIIFLIIAKYKLKEKINVSSAGDDDAWFDGKMFCHESLGYGLDCFIREGDLII